MSLLGPNGQPMNQYMSTHAGRPKNPKPVVGDAFADWGGLSRDFIHLPGGGAIGFDTSKLRIKDFRKMREHYQIGSSLHVLTFMLHQLDWHVECDDKKVADWCTINLEQIWTRLIRAMSTAFAFGFSANAVEWENDPNEGKLRLNKIKDLIPEECEVSWKYVDSALKSNSDTGQMQAPKIPIFDGISRRGTSYKVPVENCVTPETPVLMYDYSWKKAGDVQVGDELLAFDEHQPASGYRRFRKSVVEVTGPVVRPTLTIETRTGQPITVSDDHKFLVRRDAQGATFGRVESDGKTCPNCGLALVKVHGNQKYCDEECQVEFLKNRRRKAGVGYKGSWAWVDAKDLKVGDKIGYFGDVSEYSETRAAGYVAGIFDGEGHLVFNGEGNSATLAFSQRSTAVLEDTLTYLDAFGFEYNVHSNNRDDCNEIVIAGGRREIARFMNVFDPVRLKSKSIGMFDGVAVKVGHSVDTATVSGIYDSGEQVVSKIQTSTRTLITEGYLSHNSLWYPLLMENGDYKGRQLLRTAFQPWFFSTLIHLYQNKYFERFGEPVPIGRAPYNDKVTMNDKTVYGYDLMATILSNLRSRSAVVLPNTRSKEGLNDQPEFDYQVEYLESQMRGADFERYLTRLDEEMSLALFTPLLLLRTADAGGFNQGIAHCVTPETPMLMEDLSWKPAGELVPGDRLVSFDEEPTYGRGNGNNARCFAIATVEANGRVEKPCMEIRTDSGQPITASKDHPFMVWRRMTGSGRNMGLVWVNAEDLKVGDQIAKFADPWDDESVNVSQRDLGWIAGFFDGEGSIKKNISNAGYSGRGQELAVHQVDGPVLERALSILDKLEIDYTLSDGRRSTIGGKFVHTVRINGGFRGVVKFLGLVRPVRLMNNFEPDWEERGVRRKQTYDLATITQLTDVGSREVATVQTSTGTFITAGYLSHNTQLYLWMLNAVAGDIAEYIDKYILRYMAIYNFGPKAKTPRIRFRKLGVAQQETLRAIVQSLIQKGMVKPNIEELGQHIGLDLEEIEQVTEPEAEPKDPFNDPEDDPEAGDDNGNKDGRIGRPERLKDGDGPKPGSTTKAISGRIAEQIRRAYRMDKLDEWMPAPGFRRQLVAELQQNGHADARGAATRFDAHVIGALTDVARGAVFDSADDFVKYAEGMIEAEGNRLYGAA